MDARRSILTPVMVLAFVACSATPPVQVPPLTVATPPPAASSSKAKPASMLDTVRGLQASALASTRATEIVESLTKEVGGRISGGAKDKPAVDWAMRALARQGLAAVHMEASKVPHWERGVERAELILGSMPSKKGQNLTLAVTALGGSSATPETGIEGAVVEVDSIAALEKLDPKAVAGKIIFVQRKMRRSRDGSGYGEAVGVRYAGPVRAAAKGAAAVLIRSVGTDEVAPHTGATAHDDVKVVPSGALSGADADRLHRLIEEKGTKNAIRVRLTLTPKWLPEADSFNVMGDIPGRDKDKKDEIVLMGAHLDSWDLGTGALDDGAGCAIVMEAARLIADLPVAPRRTVRVVLFAAEELGLSGAKSYAKAHAAEMPHHVLALEADSGTDKVFGTRYLGSPDKRARFDEVATMLAPLGIESSDKDAFGGADISPLRKLGVPILDLEQDFSGYFDLHHTANDTFEHVNKEGLAQAAAAFATAAWWAAEMDGDLGRVPEDKRATKW